MSSISEVRTLALPATIGGVESNVTESGGSNVGQVSGGFPQNVLQALQNASHSGSAQSVIQPGFVLSDQSAKQLLNRAENLAQDAFAKASNPGATNADKLIAQEEMQEANGLRATASRGRPQYMQQQISEISNLEQNALSRVSRPGANSQDRLLGQFEMQLGALGTHWVDSELSPPKIQPL